MLSNVKRVSMRVKYGEFFYVVKLNAFVGYYVHITTLTDHTSVKLF